MKSKFLFLFGVFFLTACASVEATRYYQLPDSAFRAPATRRAEVAVKLVLASHLSGEPLLYQTDAYHLNFAQKNLWATPLNEALVANLSNKLNQFSGSHAYVPQHLAAKNAPVLNIYVDRFQGTYRGETEVSGYAQWEGGARVPFQVQTPQQGDGYAAMVASLNEGLAEVARVIVR